MKLPPIINHDQSWIEDWKTESFAPPDELRKEVAKWLFERPPVIREIARKFPPLCLVRAVRPLACPAKGTIGFVFSYMEDGGVTVVQSPSSTVRAGCKAEWLEVVGYRALITPDLIASILDEQPN